MNGIKNNNNKRKIMNATVKQYLGSLKERYTL
jgi:hypothetical protein